MGVGVGGEKVGERCSDEREWREVGERCDEGEGGKEGGEVL